MRSLALCAIAIGLLAGCDRLKSSAKNDDAGASGGGGVLSSLFGTDFEGEITTAVTQRGRPAPMQVVFGIKKPKYRIDSTGDAQAQGSFIVDLPTRKGYMLAHAQKTAMVVDLDKMKDLRGHVPGTPNAKAVPTAPSTPPKIDKTGKKDVVAGYACEIWIITSEGKRADACVAEGITWIDIGDLGLASPEITAAALATEANRFPLRVITFDPKNVEESRMEAKTIEKKKLDDARFVPPPDYKVMDISALMGGIPTAGRPTAPKR